MMSRLFDDGTAYTDEGGEFIGSVTLCWSIETRSFQSTNTVVISRLFIFIFYDGTAYTDEGGEFIGSVTLCWSIGTRS